VTTVWGGLLCSFKLALPTSCVDGLTFDSLLTKQRVKDIE